MARNRQRAKQRKARQQAQGGQPQGGQPQGGQPADAASSDAEAPAEKPASKPEVRKAEAKQAGSAKAAPAKKADSAPRERGRVSGFFRSVWAELKRVQWPDRRQVSTLTGVVIGFVIIAGAYLGLIDALAKQIVDVTIF